MFAWNTDLFRRMSIGEDHETVKDVSIKVSSPRTHLRRGMPRYTDYLITIRTCNIAFALHSSHVRRRFSEFVWLRGVLAKNAMTVKPPELPPKQVFGRFRRQFVLERQERLQTFLRELVKETTFLSDTTLHLFLQSRLSVDEISYCISGGERRPITSIIIESYNKIPSTSCTKPTVVQSPSRNSSPPGNYPYTSSGYESAICSCCGKKGLSQTTNCVCGSGWSTGAHGGGDSPMYASFNGSYSCADQDHTDGATVLPSGRLLLSYKEGDDELWERASYWKGFQENMSYEDICQCSQFIQYDADDEDILRYKNDILTPPKKLKSRKYLDSISSKSIIDENSTSSSSEFSDFEGDEKSLTIDVIKTEYDVIDSDIDTNVLLVHRKSKNSKDGTDSDFSTVHSSIDEPVEQTPVVSGKYEDYDVIDMVNIRS